VRGREGGREGASERDRNRNRDEENTGKQREREGEATERRRERESETTYFGVVRESLVVPAVLVPPLPSPPPFGVPSTDPRRVVYRCAPPTLPPPRARCPLCHPPLHDPPGCDYLVLLYSLPHPSYLPCDASAATRRRTRTLGAPLLLAADAKAARRCTWEDGEGGERAERGSLQRATGKLP